MTIHLLLKNGLKFRARWGIFFKEQLKEQEYLYITQAYYYRVIESIESLCDYQK